jgi:hypothetical protein
MTGSGTSAQRTALSVTGTASTGVVNSLQLRTNDADRLVINTSGNVGIGTASPSNILSLGGDSARSIWMERHTVTNTAGNNLTLQAGGATTSATDRAGGALMLSGGTATGTGSSSIGFFTATAGSTGTTDNVPSLKMTVLGNGNVGIGTATPQERLDIAAATGTSVLRLAAATGNGAIQINANSTANAANELVVGGAAVNGDFSAISQATDAVISAEQRDLVLAARNASGNIDFTTGATDTLKMVLTNNGRLGVGVPNPATTIDAGSGTITAARVTGLSAPTAASDAATKAYVDAAASGGGGSGTTSPVILFIGYTNATVNGALGGPRGLDNMCALQFPNSRAMRASDIPFVAAGFTTQPAWIFCDLVQYGGGTSYICGGGGGVSGLNPTDVNCQGFNSSWNQLNAWTYGFNGVGTSNCSSAQRVNCVLTNGNKFVATQGVYKGGVYLGHYNGTTVTQSGQTVHGIIDKTTGSFRLGTKPPSAAGGASIRYSQPNCTGTPYFMSNQAPNVDQFGTLSNVVPGCTGAATCFTNFKRWNGNSTGTQFCVTQSQRSANGVCTNYYEDACEWGYATYYEMTDMATPNYDCATINGSTVTYNACTLGAVQ